MGDGDILEGDVELLRSSSQVGADALGDGFSLGDQFRSVELRDNGFEDFIANGGQDSFVVVLTKILSRIINKCNMNGSPIERLTW